MRKFLIILTIFLASGKCFADTVIIDASGWTQDQKNGTTVACFRLLDKAGITFTSVKVNLPDIEISSPSAAIDTVITKQNIETEYQAWMNEVNAATLIEMQKIQAMQTELNSHEMKKISLADIDSKIDSITNLTQAKAFLKRLTHFLWAKGYFENN